MYKGNNTQTSPSMSDKVCGKSTHLWANISLSDGACFQLWGTHIYISDGCEQDKWQC